jgi:hypothetical protein
MVGTFLIGNHLSTTNKRRAYIVGAIHELPLLYLVSVRRFCWRQEACTIAVQELVRIVKRAGLLTFFMTIINNRKNPPLQIQCPKNPFLYSTLIL